MHRLGKNLLFTLPVAECRDRATVIVVPIMFLYRDLREHADKPGHVGDARDGGVVGVGVHGGMVAQGTAVVQYGAEGDGAVMFAHKRGGCAVPGNRCARDRGGGNPRESTSDNVAYRVTEYCRATRRRRRGGWSMTRKEKYSALGQVARSGAVILGLAFHNLIHYRML